MHVHGASPAMRYMYVHAARASSFTLHAGMAMYVVYMYNWLSKFKSDAKCHREGKLPDCVGLVNSRDRSLSLEGKHGDGKNFVEHSSSTASQMFHVEDVVDCVCEMKTR